jgi:hypothetical protein
VQHLLQRDPSGRPEIGADGVGRRDEGREHHLVVAGRAALDAAEAATPAFLDETFAGLTTAGRAQLTRLLGKLLGVSSGG